MKFSAVKKCNCIAMCSVLPAKFSYSVKRQSKNNAKKSNTLLMQKITNRYDFFSNILAQMMRSLAIKFGTICAQLLIVLLKGR